VRQLKNGKEPGLAYEAIVCTSCQVSVLSIFPPVCIIPCAVHRSRFFNNISKHKKVGVIFLKLKKKFLAGSKYYFSFSALG
jgi:hypothetical protein